MKTWDLIIIGAGSVGVPTAMYTAQSGLSVLVIDRRHTAGQGEAKRAIGGVRATHSDPAKIRLTMESRTIFKNFTEETGRPIHWKQGGYFFPAYGEREEGILLETLKIQQAQGLEIEWIDPSQCRELVPGLEANDLLGGTYSPKDGYASTIDSNAAFLAESIAAGVDFRFDEMVTGFNTEDGAVTAVKTDKDTYGCKAVINAAGVGAEAIAKLAGTDLPILPDTHEAGITEPLGHFFDPMVVDIRKGQGSANVYFYQNEIGQVVFCLTPDPPINGTDSRSTSEFLPLVSRRMINLLPRLGRAKVRRVWRGLYPNTPDGQPFIDADPNMNGMYHAAGMCGQGYMLGPGIGKLMTRWLHGSLGDDDQMVLEQFRLDREFSGTELLK